MKWPINEVSEPYQLLQEQLHFSFRHKGLQHGQACQPTLVVITEENDDKERRGEDGDAKEHVVEVAPDERHGLLGLVAPHYRRGHHEAQCDAELK